MPEAKEWWSGFTLRKATMIIAISGIISSITQSVFVTISFNRGDSTPTLVQDALMESFYETTDSPGNADEEIDPEFDPIFYMVIAGFLLFSAFFNVVLLIGSIKRDKKALERWISFQCIILTIMLISGLIEDSSSSLTLNMAYQMYIIYVVNAFAAELNKENSLPFHVQFTFKNV